MKPKIFQSWKELELIVWLSPETVSGSLLDSYIFELIISLSLVMVGLTVYQTHIYLDSAFGLV